MASMGNPARQIKDRALSLRSIRVMVSPPPITFAERRSVLQVLEQFGPVEMFQLAPGFSSNFVSATKEVSTAQRLLSSSPLTYNFVDSSGKSADEIHIADLTEPESLAGGQPQVRTLAPGTRLQAWKQQGQQQGQQQQKSEQAQAQAQAQRQFKLEIFPAPEFRHRFSMAGSPLHGAWPQAHKLDRSFMTTTLQQTLPRTMVGKGLAHWLMDLSTAYREQRKKKRLQIKSFLPSHMSKGSAE